MKTANWIWLTMMAMLCGLWACEGTAPEALVGPAFGKVELALSLAGDQCGVTKVTATVEAEDLKVPIGPVELMISQEKVTGVIATVPAGTQRKVSVNAQNAVSQVVYRGSSFVDVQKDQTTKVELTLFRDFKTCPTTTTTPEVGTGSLNIAGSLSNDFLGFVPADTQMDEHGVVYFLDSANRAVRRYDIPSGKFLEPFAVPADSAMMAVAPAGDSIYVAYNRNRIDVVDVTAGKRTFFVATPEQVTALEVVGSYLFAGDMSGAWSTHALYSRKTGVRTSAVDWRNTPADVAFSPRLNRMFWLTSGVSPSDLEYQDVDMEKGTLGQNKDSPYHGDYSLRAPLRLFPGEDRLGVGSGLVFNTADLTFDGSMGCGFTDLAFHGDTLFLLNGDRENAIVTEMTQRYEEFTETVFAGRPIRLFVHGDSMVVITEAKEGGIRIITQVLKQVVPVVRSAGNLS